MDSRGTTKGAYQKIEKKTEVLTVWFMTNLHVVGVS